jgi:hypothetical protein
LHARTQCTILGNYILDVESQMAHVDAADSEGSAGAPDEADEVAITPSMVEAGESVLASVNLDFETYEDAAMRVYLEMERARIQDRKSRSNAAYRNEISESL